MQYKIPSGPQLQCDVVSIVQLFVASGELPCACLHAGPHHGLHTPVRPHLPLLHAHPGRPRLPGLELRPRLYHAGEGQHSDLILLSLAVVVSDVNSVSLLKTSG